MIKAIRVNNSELGRTELSNSMLHLQQDEMQYKVRDKHRRQDLCSGWSKHTKG